MSTIDYLRLKINHTLRPIPHVRGMRLTGPAEDMYYRSKNPKAFLEKIGKCIDRDAHLLKPVIIDGEEFIIMNSDIKPTPVLKGKSAERFHSEINNGEISDEQRSFLDECTKLLDRLDMTPPDPFQREKEWDASRGIPFRPFRPERMKEGFRYEVR